MISKQKTIGANAIRVVAQSLCPELLLEMSNDLAKGEWIASDTIYGEALTRFEQVARRQNLIENL